MLVIDSSSTILYDFNDRNRLNEFSSIDNCFLLFFVFVFKNKNTFIRHWMPTQTQIYIQIRYNCRFAFAANSHTTAMNGAREKINKENINHMLNASVLYERHAPLRIKLVACGMFMRRLRPTVTWHLHERTNSQTHVSRHAWTKADAWIVSWYALLRYKTTHSVSQWVLDEGLL